MHPNPRLFSFVGGREERRNATESRTITGDPLPLIERLDIALGNGAGGIPSGAVSGPNAGGHMGIHRVQIARIREAACDLIGRCSPP